MATIYHTTPQDIAASIAAKWPSVVDPARLERALVIVTSRGLEMARQDEHGKPIEPSWEVLIVRGTSQHYIVRKGNCTCPDSAIAHHICKHRLAAYIFKQLMMEA